MPTTRPLAALALAVAIATLAAGCGKSVPEIRIQGEEVRCTTATAAVTDLPVLVSVPAAVEPEQRVKVATRMMGWVRELHAREGDTVRAGQLLISIDDQDMRAKRAQVEAGIAEAEAVVANAEKTAERFRNLYAQNSVSKQQLDDVLTGLERAKAGLAKAKAAREEIEVHLGYLDIVSPIDGIVSRRMVEEGDMAAPGHPLLFVDRTDRMKIVARLGEKDVDRVAAGDSVTLRVTSLDGAVYRTVVTRVIPSANPGSHTYDVEMYVDNPDGRLRPGMYARAEFTVGSRRGVVVPPAAIRRRGQLTGVFTVDDENTAHLHWVRLGETFPAGVEVLSGLAGGETVVVSSEKPLIQGDKVVR